MSPSKKKKEIEAKETAQRRYFSSNRGGLNAGAQQGGATQPKPES